MEEEVNDNLEFGSLDEAFEEKEPEADEYEKKLEPLEEEEGLDEFNLTQYADYEE